MSPRKPKRNRGGQPGNQNARKHGFYSAFLSPSDKEAYRRAELAGESCQLAVVTGRLRAVFEQDPGNTRALREAVATLTRYFRRHGDLDVEETAELRKMLRQALREAGRQCQENANTTGIEQHTP